MVAKKTALALAVDKANNVIPLREEKVQFQDFTHDLDVPVTGDAKVHITANEATEVRAALSLENASVDRWKRLYPWFETKFGDKVFERGADGYKAAKFLLCEVNPRWKPMPQRGDESIEAEAAKAARIAVSKLAEQALTRMQMHSERDKAAANAGDVAGDTRKTTPYTEKRDGWIKSIRRVIESNKTPETQKQQAIRDLAVLQAASNGKWARIQSLIPILPKPVFDYVEMGKVPENWEKAKLLYTVNGASQVGTEPAKDQGKGAEPSVATPRTAGAEDRKAGAVTITKGADLKTEAPEAPKDEKKARPPRKTPVKQISK